MKNHFFRLVNSIVKPLENYFLLQTNDLKRFENSEGVLQAKDIIDLTVEPEPEPVPKPVEIKTDKVGYIKIWLDTAKTKCVIIYK